MALTFIRKDVAPTYICLSTDVVNNAVAGASIKGATLLLVDTGTWKIVTDDLTLKDYTFPVILNGDVTVGTVVQGASGTDPWMVNVIKPSVIHGVSGVPFTSSDQSGGVASVTDTPPGGFIQMITDIFISVDTAMSVTFKEETSGTVITGPYYMTANSSLHLLPYGKMWELSAVLRRLQVITSHSGNIMVDAYYYNVVAPT